MSSSFFWIYLDILDFFLPLSVASSMFCLSSLCLTKISSCNFKYRCSRDRSESVYLPLYCMYCPLYNFSDARLVTAAVNILFLGASLSSVSSGGYSSSGSSGSSPKPPKSCSGCPCSSLFSSPSMIGWPSASRTGSPYLPYCPGSPSFKS